MQFIEFFIDEVFRTFRQKNMNDEKILFLLLFVNL